MQPLLKGVVTLSLTRHNRTVWHCDVSQPTRVKSKPHMSSPYIIEDVSAFLHNTPGITVLYLSSPLFHTFTGLCLYTLEQERSNSGKDKTVNGADTAGRVHSEGLCVWYERT